MSLSLMSPPSLQQQRQRRRRRRGRRIQRRRGERWLALFRLPLFFSLSSPLLDAFTVCHWMCSPLLFYLFFLALDECSWSRIIVSCISKCMQFPTFYDFRRKRRQMTFLFTKKELAIKLFNKGKRKTKICFACILLT